MLDRGRVAHLGQPHDAFLLGQAVGLALFGRKLHFGVAEHLGRQLGEHLLLRSPQDVIAHRAAHPAGLHFRREEARREELENADQVFGAVFHGRAGECPAASPGERADDFARRAAAILDPLRFVQYHQVEGDRIVRTSRSRRRTS